ncbi:FecR family protein [Maribellus maritimus]|uniref:FecR family protein n=1 Tax=Maribellus maritimus TaxID=2870838 RepID=UPI001EEC5911|nr:FecR domain-containing protein [Maribellus maritimus]MCG6187283.1 FecR domain-containing protein [Maribellus maritimus]
MKKFLSYFENQKFVKWVFNPNEELDYYWEEFIRKNPKEKDQIQQSRIVLLSLKSKKTKDLKDIPHELFSKISNNIHQKKKQFTTVRVIFGVLRYSAVAVLFFTLGIVFYTYRKPVSYLDVYKQNTEMQSVGNAQLILGNGENVQIPEKESEIVYQPNGKIVINKKDTVVSKTDFSETDVNQLIVPYGKNASIKLPDGSFAYLNAGSRLIYPSAFEKNKREVLLIGEGYFEVKHNNEIPFIVRTNEVEVVDLGTEFNVSAYPSDNVIETVLVEGIVKIRRNGFHLLYSEYILEPNQRAAYNKQNSETKITSVDVINYVSWHVGYLNFETSDLSRIVKKLERYYNIRIVLADPVLGIRTISGKLKLEEDKESVLKVLAKTASVQLEKINETTYKMR